MLAETTLAISWMFWSLAAWDFTTEIYATLLCRVDVTDAYLKEYMSAISFRDHIPKVCPTNVFKLVKLHIKSSLFPGSQLVARVNDLKWMEQSVESLSLLYLQKILHMNIWVIMNAQNVSLSLCMLVCKCKGTDTWRLLLSAKFLEKHQYIKLTRGFLHSTHVRNLLIVLAFWAVADISGSISVIFFDLCKGGSTATGVLTSKSTAS